MPIRNEKRCSDNAMTHWFSRLQRPTLHYLIKIPRVTGPTREKHLSNAATATNESRQKQQPKEQHILPCYSTVNRRRRASRFGKTSSHPYATRIAVPLKDGYRGALSVLGSLRTATAVAGYGEFQTAEPNGRRGQGSFGLVGRFGPGRFKRLSRMSWVVGLREGINCSVLMENRTVGQQGQARSGQVKSNPHLRPKDRHLSRGAVGRRGPLLSAAARCCPLLSLCPTAGQSADY